MQTQIRHFTYGSLLEPNVQTTAQSEIVFLPPRFDRINMNFIQKQTIFNKNEYIIPKYELVLKHETNFNNRLDGKENLLEKPQPIQKRKSKTLGEKGKN